MKDKNNHDENMIMPIIMLILL